MAATRNVRVLLGAFAACLLYATFADGAQRLPAQGWALLAIGIVSVGALGAWLYGHGLALNGSRLGLLGLAGIAGFAAWAAIGIPHSVAPDRSWTSANVAIAYALTVAIGMLLGSSLKRGPETIGVTIGIVSVIAALYALAGKTIPGVHVIFDFDTTDGLSRVRAPLGYWNGLAMVCIGGLFPLLRVAADPAKRHLFRILGLLGVYVLGIVLALTYSRGGLAALAIGLIVFVALTTERLRTVVLVASAAVASAAPLAFALTRHSLTHDFAPLAARTHDARAVLIAFVLAGGLLAVWARAVFTLEGPPERGRAVGRPLAMGAAVLAAAAIVVFVATGGVGHAWHTFTKAGNPSAVTAPDRLLTLNSGTRWAWWKEAAGAFSDKPLTGWGAGSFPVTHLLYRHIGFQVQQPHSVPLQWLAEDGLPGLILAGGGLLALLAAALARARGHGPAAALFAIAIAWVVQSPFEWTWDIPGATLPMLLGLGVLAASPAAPKPVGGRAVGLTAVSVGFVLFAVSVALPSVADTQRTAALDLSGEAHASAGDLRAAAEKAELAIRLDPLATDGLLAASDIAERRGRLADARRYLLRAVRRQPYDVDSWMQLSRVGFAASDRVNGREALLHALRLDPSNGRIIAQARLAYETSIVPGESASATGSPLAPAP